jgi:hypothetical protein
MVSQEDTPGPHHWLREAAFYHVRDVSQIYLSKTDIYHQIGIGVLPVSPRCGFSGFMTDGIQTTYRTDHL